MPHCSSKYHTQIYIYILDACNCYQNNESLHDTSVVVDHLISRREWGLFQLAKLPHPSKTEQTNTQDTSLDQKKTENLFRNLQYYCPKLSEVNVSLKKGEYHIPKIPTDPTFPDKKKKAMPKTSNNTRE